VSSLINSNTVVKTESRLSTSSSSDSSSQNESDKSSPVNEALDLPEQN
jgi:hypothetical protein